MGKTNSKLKKDALDKLAAETYCKFLSVYAVALSTNRVVPIL